MLSESFRGPAAPGWAAILGRSLLPFAALVLLASTIWIGPYGFAIGCIAWWQIARRIR